MTFSDPNMVTTVLSAGTKQELAHGVFVQLAPARPRDQMPGKGGGKPYAPAGHVQGHGGHSPEAKLFVLRYELFVRVPAW